MNGNTVRVNISLPSDLVSVLKRLTHPRGMSRFLAEAAREKIRIEERDKAFRELISAPATFTNVGDSAGYVRKMRLLDEKRLKRLGI